MGLCAFTGLPCSAVHAAHRAQGTGHWALGTLGSTAPVFLPWDTARVCPRWPCAHYVGPYNLEATGVLGNLSSQSLSLFYLWNIYLSNMCLPRLIPHFLTLSHFQFHVSLFYFLRDFFHFILPTSTEYLTSTMLFLIYKSSFSFFLFLISILFSRIQDLVSPKISIIDIQFLLFAFLELSSFCCVVFFLFNLLFLFLFCCHLLASLFGLGDYVKCLLTHGTDISMGKTDWNVCRVVFLERCFYSRP